MILRMGIRSRREQDLLEWTQSSFYWATSSRYPKLTMRRTSNGLTPVTMMIWDDTKHMLSDCVLLYRTCFSGDAVRSEQFAIAQLPLFCSYKALAGMIEKVWDIAENKDDSLKTCCQATGEVKFHFTYLYLAICVSSSSRHCRLLSFCTDLAVSFLDIWWRLPHRSLFTHTWPNISIFFPVNLIRPNLICREYNRLWANSMIRCTQKLLIHKMPLCLLAAVTWLLHCNSLII